MKKDQRLTTFVLTKNNTPITSPLVTARKFGDWINSKYGSDVSENLIRIKSNGLQEAHPGTKIGKYFDNNYFDDPSLNSIYIPKSNKIFSKLLKHRLIEASDCSQTGNHANELRVFTLDQINQFMKAKVSSDFPDIRDAFAINIRATEDDLKTISLPKTKTRKNKLFDNRTKYMTMRQLEEIVGSKLIIVEERE